MPAEQSATVGQQSSEEVRLELVLAMDLNEIAGDEEWFKESIAQDVAKAVGGDPSKVRIISLVAGSIRVLMALDEGICGDGRGALDVANDLQQQAADPNSPLKSGGITGATIGANVMIEKVGKVQISGEGLNQEVKSLQAALKSTQHQLHAMELSFDEASQRAEQLAFELDYNKHLCEDRAHEVSSPMPVLSYFCASVSISGICVLLKFRSIV
jgi:hypothetical protein